MNNAISTVVKHGQIMSFSIPDPEEWEQMGVMANVLCKSGMYSGATEATATVAKMLKAREMHVGPIWAIERFYYFNGNLTLDGQGMLALIRRSGDVNYHVTHPNETTAKCSMIRKGDEKATELTWTWADAEKAKLTGKDNWKKYPKTMLRWRVIADCARIVCPDYIQGMYLADELGAETDEEGAPKYEDDPNAVLPSEPVTPSEPKAPKPQTPNLKGSSADTPEIRKKLSQQFNIMFNDLCKRVGLSLGRTPNTIHIKSAMYYWAQEDLPNNDHVDMEMEGLFDKSGVHVSLLGVKWLETSMQYAKGKDGFERVKQYLSALYDKDPIKKESSKVKTEPQQLEQAELPVETNSPVDDDLSLSVDPPTTEPDELSGLLEEFKEMQTEFNSYGFKGTKISVRISKKHSYVATKEPTVGIMKNVVAEMAEVYVKMAEGTDLDEIFKSI